MNSVVQRYDFQNSDRRSFADSLSILSGKAEDIVQFFKDHHDQFDHLSHMEDIDKVDAATDKIIAALTTPEDTVTVYRGIELGPEDVEPDLEKPGICWTFDKDTAERFVMQFDDDNPDFAPCILIAKFNKDDIDVLYSVAANTDEPDENEIRVYKDAEPIEIEYEVL